MRLEIETIVLNGMPWLPCVFVELNRLVDVDWRWRIIEGAAANVRDTSWMARQKPLLSTDGTRQFLDDLCCHPRVSVQRNAMWNGKCEMMNAPMSGMTEPGVLMQVDSDELWTAEQYRGVIRMFEEEPDLSVAHFPCTYYLSMNSYVSKEGLSANRQNDWVRAWRYRPGMRWNTHEPPVLAGNSGRHATPQETDARGLRFIHYSYATLSQVRYKEQVYKYRNASAQWLRLRSNTAWPVTNLGDWLPWCDKTAEADTIFKP